MAGSGPLRSREPQIVSHVFVMRTRTARPWPTVLALLLVALPPLVSSAASAGNVSATHPGRDCLSRATSTLVDSQVQAFRNMSREAASARRSGNTALACQKAMAGLGALDRALAIIREQSADSSRLEVCDGNKTSVRIAADIESNRRRWNLEAVEVVCKDGGRSSERPSARVVAPAADPQPSRSPSAAANREPTEREMLQAMADRLNDAKAAQEAQGKKGCAEMNTSNNPLDAIACAVHGSRIGESARNIRITHFEKINCEKAREPGYVCDYSINVSAPSLGALNPSTRHPVTGTKRFVPSKRGWIAIEK